jgi:D-beta-D-heptose 7-phosphate kinase/D-beta-D-heptose 1-phosphate adenosyltransferase
MTVSPARARSLVDRFASLRALVVGDVMLDEFTIGRVDRISPEAPVPVVAFDRAEHRLGGAANVAHNLRALGAAVDVVGIVGDDEAATTLRAALDRAGIGHALATADDRPTTRKVRVVTTRNQQVARIDYESDLDIAESLASRLVAEIGARVGTASVVVVSDYAKGVVTAPVMQFLARQAAAKPLPLLVDPKLPHLALYAGATVVTPNHHEAEAATGRRIRDVADARAAARALRAKIGCASVLITWGEHGMWVLEGERAAPGGEARIVDETHLPAVAREVADVTGAGDTVVATVALAIAAKASLAEAAALANHAAGIAVAHFGPTAVNAADLAASFTSPP